MLVLVREYPKLIFYARTVSRSPSVNQTGKQRRVSETGSKSIMYFLVSVQDIARHLLRLGSLHRRWNVGVRETTRLGITELEFKPFGMNGCYVDSRRSSGFHSVGSDT